MLNLTSRFAASIVLLLCFCAPSQSSTYYVTPTGDDSSAGTRESPFVSIQKAVDVASSGDTVRVAAGRYRKVGDSSSLITISGKSRLTIEGEAGTILDCSDTTIPSGTAWTADGDGVYKKHLPMDAFGQFAAVTVDDGTGPKLLVTGYSDSAVGGLAGHVYLPDDKWYWKEHLKYGVNDDHTYEHVFDFWETLRGLAFHNVGETDYSFSEEDNDGYLYVHLTDGVNALNPADFTIRASRHKRGDTVYCGIRLTNDANFITIKGFEFHNGYQAIYIDDSTGSVIEDCTFVAFKNGVWMTGDPDGAWGAESITIRQCDFTVNPFSAHVGKTWSYAEQIWACQKEFGWQDWWTISGWRTLGGHHIHDNYIHESWDGISLGSDHGDWKNSEVNHNLIVNCLDDGIDIYGNCANAKVHHNISINNQNLTRLRAIGSSDAPMYFYNNILLQGPLTDNGLNFSSGNKGDGTGYFYHSTIEGNDHDNGIFCNQNKTASYDNWYWANNLFQGHQWTKHDPDGATSGFTIDWNAAHNVYCLRPGFTSWTYPGRVDSSFDPDRHIDTDGTTLWSLQPPRWTKYDPPAACPRDYVRFYDVSLRAESEARGRGADLTALWGFTPPGHLSNDCGALAYGEDMPVVPRLQSME